MVQQYILRDQAGVLAPTTSHGLTFLHQVPKLMAPKGLKTLSVQVLAEMVERLQTLLEELTFRNFQLEVPLLPIYLIKRLTSVCFAIKFCLGTSQGHGGK